MATRILLTADHHLMNDPRDLTDGQTRKQFFPLLLTKQWVPLWFIRLILRVLRWSSLRMFTRLLLTSLRETFDGQITVGDQVHGIEERGAVGVAGLTMLRQFKRLIAGCAEPLFHVPSEHPLGYWEGVDYVPHWDRGQRRFCWEIRRDIGGRLDLEAIQNWQREIGPLWGHVEREGHHLVWLTTDFWRWRTYVAEIPELERLRHEQDAFLEQTLSAVPNESAILFTHRVDPVFEDPLLRRYHRKFRAVVFADYHSRRSAKRKTAKFHPHRFALWFVPALWGMQFGLGWRGYAVLTLEDGRASFEQRKL